MGKLFLIALMRDVGLDKFNNMVIEARNQLVAEDKWVKLGDFEQLLDTQIATLNDRDVPAPIVKMLLNQRGQVLAKASNMYFDNGHISFLPVIPRTYLSIYTQMLMVKHNGKTGYTLLKPTAITDIMDTPEDPYYIYDIEDGEAMLGMAPRQKAEKLINKQRRFGLTEVEVIALGVHTDVLSRHYMDAVGSRYDSDGIPYLFLEGGNPVLSRSHFDTNDHLFGAASCGSRA